MIKDKKLRIVSKITDFNFVPVDATGKKIRGTSDEKVKDYDHYGKY